ncbi:hypothetical protein AVEN_123731-1 [Araneus ventricosus]|uniref:Uncharacterized protein n=1 Tax=Araneus ventricosus TaxID=182803 RepID=A0A4Y2BLF3_ARAVE|nr:hypothetical protein AVEN_123731-1 [Araneus ventricosus]
MLSSLHAGQTRAIGPTRPVENSVTDPNIFSIVFFVRPGSSPPKFSLSAQATPIAFSPRPLKLINHWLKRTARSGHLIAESSRSIQETPKGSNTLLDSRNFEGKSKKPVRKGRLAETNPKIW